MRLTLIQPAIVVACWLLSQVTWAQSPIYVGLDADMSAVAAEGGIAIQRGAQIAIDEINRNGGVLGRELALMVKDHRGNPARGIRNVQAFAEQPDLVAILGGVHTPVALQELQIVHDNKLLFLIPWAAGTTVVENGHEPNYVFRVSVRDEQAGQVLMAHAQKRGVKKVALILERTGWGRSNQASLQKAAPQYGITVTGIAWVNWRQKAFDDEMEDLMRTDPEALILVSNAPEGAVVFDAKTRHPKAKPLDLISHWGVAGGNFVDLVGKDALSRVHMAVLQTFSFQQPFDSQRAASVFEHYQRSFDSHVLPKSIPSAVGVAHAYDLIHLLKLAIDSAGSLNREKIREAMLKIPEYKGLVKHYRPPFRDGLQDALLAQDYMMSRYDEDGDLVPIQ